MDIEQRTVLFAKLGLLINSYLSGSDCDAGVVKLLDKAIKQSEDNNPWFDSNSQRKALKAIAEMLDEKALRDWLEPYPDVFAGFANPRRVAVIMAGNIPLVGFHDFLCVLMSGHSAVVKLSSNDSFLLPALNEIISNLSGGEAFSVEFSRDILKSFDAVIASGSNNSARYFEYYFSKYPHIIRKNRNSVALLHGGESFDELALLGDDVFSYYGLGCRNVTKIFIPEHYDFSLMKSAWQKYESIKTHGRFFNNYEYNKAVFIINNVPHIDFEYVLISQAESLSSPVGVLHYEFYTDSTMVEKELQQKSELIQCKLGDIEVFDGSTAFGSSQNPGLSDYADGVDTMKFLLSLR